jgi:hypothetical protein
MNSRHASGPFRCGHAVAMSENAGTPSRVQVRASITGRTASGRPGTVLNGPSAAGRKKVSSYWGLPSIRDSVS